MDIRCPECHVATIATIHRVSLGIFWDMAMPVCGCAVSRALPVIALALTCFLAFAPAAHPTETVTIGDLVFVNKALVGVGRLPSDLRDKFGETFGSGSAIALDAKSWMRTPAGYQGTFYMLPDRGYNVTGTSDYRARINKLFITFKPNITCAPKMARLSDPCCGVQAPVTVPG